MRAAASLKGSYHNKAENATGPGEVKRPSSVQSLIAFVIINSQE